MSKSISSKNPLYGNCKVLSPDNILMFRCHFKKANWYIKRDLADIIKEEPLTIKLKFSPQGLGNHGKTYGLSEIKNICVNCGSSEELTRHHVVPYCYRKFLPDNIKSHNFYDVLSLCVDCHIQYEYKANEYKNILAEKYNAPINGDYSLNRDLVKLKRLASCLLNESINVPKNRIKEIKEIIKNKLNIKRLTKRRILDILDSKSFSLKRTHGQMVINQIDNIDEFIISWRKHFIENNKCEFLPKNWSINN